MAGFHRVNQVVLDFFKFFVGQLAFQQVHSGVAHQGPGLLGQQADTLCGGVRPLVELTGQVFHGKDAGSCFLGKLGVGVIHRRLAEDVFHRLDKLLLAESFHIVPV